MRIESGLSDTWSLLGHHTSAPIIWLEVAIHGAPDGVVAHWTPPSHGGRGATRGLPPYSTVSESASPGCFVYGRSTNTRPPERRKERGTADSRSVSDIDSIARSVSRSRATTSAGATMRASMRRVPAIVLSDGCTATARS